MRCRWRSGIKTHGSRGGYRVWGSDNYKDCRVGWLSLIALEASEGKNDRHRAVNSRPVMKTFLALLGYTKFSPDVCMCVYFFLLGLVCWFSSRICTSMLFSNIYTYDVF